MIFFIICQFFCNWLMIIFSLHMPLSCSLFSLSSPISASSSNTTFFYRHLYKVNKNPMEFKCLTEVFTSLVWYVTTLEYCQATIHHLNTLRQQRQNLDNSVISSCDFKKAFFISTIETNLCCVYLWLLNSKLSHFINF